MEMNDISNFQIRDYDKNPIVIKDYGAYFQNSIIMLLATTLIILWIGDFQAGRFEQIDIHSYEFFKLIGAVIFILWFFNYLYKLPSRFKKTPSLFKLSNKEICNIEYVYDKKVWEINTYAPLRNAQQVSFCIVSELPNRFGRWHYLSAWQLYRKSSIGVHIGKATLFIRYLLTYFLFVFPYKLWRLLKAKEPLSLLYKNIFIQFNNRNYFLVNIYSKKDFDELMEYFRFHHVAIANKTYFIPHLQNDGWFTDKEEKWINEFNQQGVTNG